MLGFSPKYTNYQFTSTLQSVHIILFRGASLERTQVQDTAVHATTLPSLWVLCLINNSPTILLLVWVSSAGALVCQEIYQLAPFESYQSRNLPLGTGCPNKIQNVTNFAVLSIKDISHSILFNLNPRNFRHTNQETVWAVCYSKWLRQSRQTILMIQLFSWNWK